jgi:hypothetical protein
MRADRLSRIEDVPQMNRSMVALSALLALTPAVTRAQKTYANVIEIDARHPSPPCCATTLSSQSIVGQAFNVPYLGAFDAVLGEFTIALTGKQTDEVFNFKAYLQELDDVDAMGNPIGPIIYESRTFTVQKAFDVFKTGGPSLGGVPLTTAGDVAVTPGKDYLLYLKTDATNPANQLYIELAGDVYAGGAAYLRSNSGPNPSYRLAPDGNDLSFHTAFGYSTAPEPATIALVGGGVLLLGAWQRRRQRA